MCDDGEENGKNSGKHWHFDRCVSCNGTHGIACTSASQLTRTVNTYEGTRPNLWLDRQESAICGYMRFWLLIRCLLALLSGLAVIAPATAQDRLAYVIGNGTSANGHVAAPAQDALAVSRTLLGLGFDVIRREDVSPAALPMGRTAAETVVLYYSGRTTTRDGRTILLGNRDAGWPLINTAKAFRRSGAKHVVVLIENCLNGSSDLAPLPDNRGSLEGIFLAVSSDPMGECQQDSDTTFTLKALTAMSTPDTSFADAFKAADGPGWQFSNLTEPLILLQSATEEMVISYDDLELLERLAPADRDRMRALWERAGLITAANAQPLAPRGLPAIRTVQNDTISISNRVEPVDLGKMLESQTSAAGSQAKVSPVAFTPIGNAVSGGIQIINTAPRSDVSAVATAAGLPRPSVIVGRIQVENVSFSPTVSDETITGTEVETAGFEARQIIRVDDATLYTQLVNSGAFDPSFGPRQLETALQIELDRIGCYTSTIDGIWGNNSAAAVERYYQQIGETPESLEPSVELFRKIVLRDNVNCPVIRQAARPAPAATPRATPTRANPPRASQPRATPTRAAQPRASTPRKPKAPSGQKIQLRPNIFGTGIRG